MCGYDCIWLDMEHVPLSKYSSKAVAINFMEVCNNLDISDSLHVPASILMTEGIGYAGEGNWETAMFMRGLQAAFGTPAHP